MMDEKECVSFINKIIITVDGAVLARIEENAPCNCPSKCHTCDTYIEIMGHVENAILQLSEERGWGLTHTPEVFQKGGNNAI